MRIATPILSFLLLLLVGNPVIAEQSIEEMTRQGVLQAQGMASKEESGELVPNYSRNKASEEADKIDKIDDGELKSKAHEKMVNANAASPEGITRDAMNKKTLDGFENHEIFTRAAKIWKDPVSEMEKITKEGCKEKVNEKKNQYRKKIIKEKHYDTELYEESCEKPADNVTCEKTLNVTCEAKSSIAECNACGIVFESVQGDMKWEYNFPTLTLGIIGDNSWRGHCGEFDTTASFQVKDISKIDEFRIFELGFKDHLWIKINDATIFIGSTGVVFHTAESIELRGSMVIRSWRHVGGRDLFGRPIPIRIKSDTCNCGQSPLYRNKRWAPNIDLKPYLKEGENNIWMRVIMGGSGEGWMRISAKQQCCTNACIKVTDKWKKRCWQN